MIQLRRKYLGKTRDGKWCEIVDFLEIGPRQLKTLRALRRFPHLRKGDLARIARAMGIAPRNLWEYVDKLKRKFGVASTKQLIPICEQIYGKVSACPDGEAGYMCRPTQIEKSPPKKSPFAYPARFF